MTFTITPEMFRAAFVALIAAASGYGVSMIESPASIPVSEIEVRQIQTKNQIEDIQKTIDVLIQSIQRLEAQSKLNANPDLRPEVKPQGSSETKPTGNKLSAATKNKILWPTQFYYPLPTVRTQSY